MDKQRYIRYALSLAVTTLFLLHVGRVAPISLIDHLENQAYDMRLKMMLPKAVHKQVVIVDIDEASLDAIGHWPWNRSVLSTIVDNLFDHYRIKALGFDVVFAEADRDQAATLLNNMASGPLKDSSQFQAEYTRVISTLQHDEKFAHSLANRNTVLGFVMDSDTRKGLLPESVATVNSRDQGRIPFLHPEGYTANLDILQENASGGGFFDNPLVDDDGVYRRVPLLQELNGHLYESLALAVMRAAAGSPALEMIVAPGRNSDDRLFLQWLKLGDTIIPVDENAGILIPYQGPQHSFNYISAIDIFNRQAALDQLHGKIVLFGASAPGLLDLRTTPVEAAFPGVEIHANIIQGMFDQSVLHRPGYADGFEFISIMISGIVLTFLLPLLSPLWAMVVSALVLGLLITGNLAMWSELQLVIPVAATTLLIIAMFTFHMTYGFFVEARAKRQLAHLFGQYVPPELVDEMSRKMEDINLDGEIRNMSVMFCDMRAFTTISENMEPKQLTHLINAILTPVTEIIHHQRGTIDKYLGDGVMAFWGAPLEDPDHAVNALTAATRMVQRIDELKSELQARGWPDISIAVGINSGEMNVGNKGSRFRVDYTVVGDAVNLGARLERLTRVYGVDIIAGENTRRAAAEFEFRELDRVRVKGKDQPVTIYEPLGPVAGIDQSIHMDLERFHGALDDYRARRWDDAERELLSLSRAEPERRIYQIYLERIMHFREQPPADDWDGSYTHATKY